ncbi:MAG: type IV secretion system DNA-binding domain-containing protein [bacterium]|nr:type IV secretion system DNA-binding domain-containing protein [bacterium]
MQSILLFLILGAGLVFALKALKKKAPSSLPIEDKVILMVRVTREEEKGALKKAPLAAEQMFSALHGLLRGVEAINSHVSFEICSQGPGFEFGHDGIVFYVAVPNSLYSFMEGQIYAQYPNAQIEKVDDYAQLPPKSLKSQVKVTSIVFAREYFYPIRGFRDFEVDPLSSITSSMTKVKAHEQLWFQLVVRPIPDIWQQAGHDYVAAIKEGKPVKPVSTFSVEVMAKGFINELLKVLADIPKAMTNPGSQWEAAAAAAKAAEKPQLPRLSAGQELSLKAIENKLSKMGFECLLRVVATSPDPAEATAIIQGFIASLNQFASADLNAFTAGPAAASPEEFIKAYQDRVFDENLAIVLTTEELGTVFHFPSYAVETPKISWVQAKRLEPPSDLPTQATQDVVILGRTTFRSELTTFGIKRNDRPRHFYLVGKSGTGKSTLFENMIFQDMRNGDGVGVMDPHGELVGHILDQVPDSRVEDVVILDPSDADFPVSLNMLECEDPTQRNLMASGIVAAFKQNFGYSWGPRLEYLLNYAILTLLEVPGTTLLGVTRLLSDRNYQAYIVHQVQDPVIKDFWEKEFKEMSANQKLITEAIAPIQNKVNRFLSSSTIRNIVGQAKSSINIYEMMNEKKIILFNLAKGKIGEDNANLLGSLLISRLQFSAMRRVSLPPDQRPLFFMYVDEFQNFAGGGFASILSEARKYGLALHLTHQYTAQLPEEMQDAVFGNVGTMAAFTLGAPDAHTLIREFEPYLLEEDLISLEARHIYIKLMIDNMTSKPFSAATLPPPKEKTGNREKVIALSRQKYGRDAQKVEERVRAWVEKRFDKATALAEEQASLKKVEVVPAPSVGTPAVPVAPIAQAGEVEDWTAVYGGKPPVTVSPSQPLPTTPPVVTEKPSAPASPPPSVAEPKPPSPEPEQKVEPAPKEKPFELDALGRKIYQHQEPKNPFELGRG